MTRRDEDRKPDSAEGPDKRQAAAEDAVRKAMSGKEPMTREKALAFVVAGRTKKPGVGKGM